MLIYMYFQFKGNELLCLSLLDDGWVSLLELLESCLFLTFSASLSVFSRVWAGVAVAMGSDDAPSRNKQ